MYQKAKPIFFIAETPVHAGSGDSLGYIDLPIQREIHTGYPKFEASSLKGALRQAFESKIYSDKNQNKTFFSIDAQDVIIHRVFGYDEGSLTDVEKEKLKSNFLKKEKEDKYEIDFAGAIGFTDARILLFPVKSLRGTFAWITCPRILAKLRYELEKVCGLKSEELPLASSYDEKKPIVTSKCNLDFQKKDGVANIQLGEYVYEVAQGKAGTPIDKLANWMKENVFAGSFEYWADKIVENLVLVSDDDFTDFVKFSTEIVTRIKIDNEAGTVEDGALFTTEFLPQEAVLYSLAMFSPEFKDKGMSVEQVERFFYNNKPDFFQLGGDATIGKGILKLVSKGGKL